MGLIIGMGMVADDVPLTIEVSEKISGTGTSMERAPMPLSSHPAPARVPTLVQKPASLSLLLRSRVIKAAVYSC